MSSPGSSESHDSSTIRQGITRSGAEYAQQGSLDSGGTMSMAVRSLNGVATEDSPSHLMGQLSEIKETGQKNQIGTEIGSRPLQETDMPFHSYTPQLEKIVPGKRSREDEYKGVLGKEICQLKGTIKKMCLELRDKDEENKKLRSKVAELESRVKRLRDALDKELKDHDFSHFQASDDLRSEIKKIFQ